MPTGGDPRKSYLVSCLAAALTTPGTSSKGPSIDNDTALESFLNDPNVSTLQASLGAKGGWESLTLSNEVSIQQQQQQQRSKNATSSSPAVVFIKTRPEALKAETISSTVILTTLLPSNPSASLYHALKSVYQPMLLSPTGSETPSSTTSSAMMALQSDLGASLRHSTANSSRPLSGGAAAASIAAARGPDADTDPGVLAALTSPADELAYWTDLAAGTGATAQRADTFAQIWAPVASLWSTALNPSSSEPGPGAWVALAELVDATQDALDSLWKVEHTVAYPQERMAHTIDVCSNALSRAITSLLSPARIGLFTDPFSEVREALKSALETLNAWSGALNMLTALMWPSHATHRWTGLPATAPDHDALMERLNSLLQLRFVHEQLVALLPNDFTPSTTKPTAGSSSAQLDSGDTFTPPPRPEPISIPQLDPADEPNSDDDEEAAKKRRRKKRKRVKEIDAAKAAQAEQDAAYEAACAAAKAAHAKKAAKKSSASSSAASPAVDRTPKGVFASFAGLHVLHVNAYTQPLWETAVAGYEAAMAPIEAKIATQLKSRLSPLLAAGNRPAQVLEEFSRYKDLLARPGISKAIAAEREMFLSQLLTYVAALREEFASRSGTIHGDDTAPAGGRNMPAVVTAIVWARQLAGKLNRVISVGYPLVSELPRAEELSKAAATGLQDATGYEQEAFAAWSGDVADGLEDPDTPLVLQMTGRLMDLNSSDGKLVVHYSDRLVSLLREVRQLAALGKPIQPRILAAADTAQKFYHFGVILKQVANFYNTIATQMIPSQKGMLIKTARLFEAVIRRSGGRSSSTGDKSHSVTWDNSAECEAYISKLQAAAERLTTENRKLRKYHSMFADRIVALMSTDLLRSQGKWRETLKELRGVMDTLERAGYEGMGPWKTHWDHQLYKALEFQYCMGLESLNENLPEIKVELVFKSSTGVLAFRPPLEEIRSSYYREMRKFIGLPAKFRPFNSDTSLFTELTDRNAASVAVVYHKAEDLFARLSALKSRYVDWIALGTVDLESFVESNMREVADWESNFKAVKQRGKAAEKLPSSVSVDCISVSLAPLKATVDDHMQRLADALVLSLRKAAAAHSAELDAFIKESNSALEAVPQDVDDIAAYTNTYREVRAKQEGKLVALAAFEEKNKLLRTVVGSGMDLSALKSRWDNFEATLEGHESRLAKQTDAIRGRVEDRIIAFNAELSKFAAKWAEVKPSDGTAIPDSSAALTIIRGIKNRQEEFGELKSTGKKIEEDCKSFGLPDPSWSSLDDIEIDLERTAGAWSAFEVYTNELKELRDEHWLTFRSTMYRFQDFVTKWAAALKERPVDMITVHISNELDKARKAEPLFKYVRGDAFTTEHWQVLYSALGIPSNMSITEDGDLALKFGTFHDRMDAIIASGDALKTLHSRALGEVQIREALAELVKWATVATFNLMEHTTVNGGTVHLIKEWKDLMTAVGDNQALLQSLKDSPWFAGFADEAGTWESKLAAVDGALRELNVVQRKWVYLEPIFGRGAIPYEAGRFGRVDEEFTGLMSTIATDPRVVSLAGIPDLKDSLAQLVDQVERCQKALSEFLEEKRSVFPRFYFIGDDDLLEILGQAQNPTVIQSHLKKLFAGINKVVFNDDNSAILAVKSAAGETVNLENPVPVTAAVENWMSHLSAEMISTLQSLLPQALEETNLDKYPAQILCVAEQVHFTADVERALAGGGLGGLKTQLTDRLAQYTAMDTHGDHLLGLKIKALVYDLIHNIDVIDQLNKVGARSVADWTWQKQLRYYLSDTKKALVRMSDAEFSYTYEYQGNASKLVHTPLTDKCYLTLTQAMHLGYGGNPYGPAGTGKTESVKALAAALGRQVNVANCDSGFDYKSMGRIFTGLVRCGAWGCFDEFNRLDEEVLSAVSQQIQVIQSALKAQAPHVDLLGKKVELDSSAAIFVTLNPAGKGYGGRSKLPDNLKALFRAVAMSRPDNELIAETMLAAEGFVTADELGRRLVAAFGLAKELLSPQQHYDWGLRALKSILGLAGELLSKARAEADGGSVSSDTEAVIVVQSLRLNTLSKLTFNDVSRFNGIVSDLFPTTSLQEVNHDELTGAIREVLNKRGLTEQPTQLAKMLQLYEAAKQRMGVVIVGPSGAGKTTLWSVLRAALDLQGTTVVTHTMNPKAMPREQLLGHMDMDTREWFDGVLTAAAREVIKQTEGHTWIVCDGDIDPVWIESLNSVLDDNRLLTMPSGERIQFGSNVNFVFETADLRYASPATVSRMGMVYLSQEDTDAKAIVSTWLASQEEPRMKDWVDEVFYKALQWTWEDKGSAAVVKRSYVGLVKSGLSHIAGAKSKSEFVTGLIRGLGGNLWPKDRAELAKAVFRWARESPPDPRRPLDARASGKGYVPYSGEPGFDEGALEQAAAGGVPPLVHNVDVARTMDMFNPWLESGEAFILVGPEGAGKSLCLSHGIAKLRGAVVATLHCNAQTNASHVIQKLRDTCRAESTNTGRVFRPKGGTRLVLWLKDVNLPRPDAYGTIQAVAWLQQALTYGGFYDESLEWIGLERVQVVATMNPSSTVGRYDLTERLTSIAHVAVITAPEKEALTGVVGTYLEAVVGGNKDKMAELAGIMVKVWGAVKDKWTVDDAPHYLFTPRDLTAWVLGLRRYDLESENLVDVVAWEGSRIFRDRLVGDASKSKFDALLVQALGNKPMKEAVFTGLGSRGQELLRLPRDDLKDVAKNTVKLYEREVRELGILLFDEVLDNLVAISRVLSAPGGSLLLVGESGVGRTALVALAAHAAGMPVISPAVGRGYGVKAFKADLKTVLGRAGITGEAIVWALDDYQIGIDPATLELVNSVLSAGEVPGLYTAEELDAVLAPLKEPASEAGWRGSLYEFFVSRVRANLHVALSMDPSGSDFEVRCASNPALYTRCALMWMGGWSREAMKTGGKMLLKKLVKGDKVDKAIIAQAVAIHTAAAGRGLGATPRRYVGFLQTFAGVLDEKHAKSMSEVGRLQSGLDKLAEAEKTVDELGRAAVEKKAELATAQKEADKALVAITARMEATHKQRAEMQELEGKLDVDKAKASKRQEAIESELAEVQPLVDAAKEAVGSIRQENIKDIRSLRMPPEAIRDIVEGVLRLMGNSDASWAAMKTFLGKRGVLDDIVNFDARRVDPGVRARVEDLLRERGSSFEPKNAARASVAAAPLAAWVKANVEYSHVLEKVAPLEADYSKAQRSLEKAQGKIAKLQEGLAAVDEEVAQLKSDFGAKTSEAERLKLDLEKAESIMSKAEAMIGKLSGEKERWEAQANELKAGAELIPRRALLTAAFTSYLAGEGEDVRSAALGEWRGLVGETEDWSVRGWMTSESEVLGWKSEGLPADELSVENALVILADGSQTQEGGSEEEDDSLPSVGAGTPLIVDPSSQALNWLVAHLGGNVEVIPAQDERFARSLELAVRFGKTIVVSEVDGVEPLLYPLLRKELTRVGPRQVVAVGDKSVDYSPGFRLFLVTRNPAVEVPPDAASLLRVVNFTVTRSGLEGQLLGLTLQVEQPELEQRKSACLAEEESRKVELAKLQDGLLKALAEATGSILDNQELIDTLNEAKAASNVISEQLEEARLLQADLDSQREAYRGVAQTGSQLFFLARDAGKMNHMYRYSLSWFLSLFKRVLQGDGGAGTGVEGRVSGLKDSLRKTVLSEVSRGLFKADRLPFALHVVAAGGGFGEGEWELFLGETKSNSMGLRAPSWVSGDRKAGVEALMAVVEGLDLEDVGKWAGWNGSERPEAGSWPGTRVKLSPWQEVLVIQALRPDRLVAALERFCCRMLGVASVGGGERTDLASIDAGGSTPVVLITTPGTDPAGEVREAADEAGKAYNELAMGQGQAEAAMSAVRRGAKEGSWVCLKNVHLVTSWLPSLEKELNGLECAEGFVLWLTTEAHESFPRVLLERGYKVTYEAPPGLKRNLARTYSGWSEEWVGANGDARRAGSMFALAWFHAVVQERRKYIPAGWAKFYEFSRADLKAGVDVVETGVERGYPTVHGLLENAIYGGRVDNEYDLRVLRTYLRRTFNDEVLTGSSRVAEGVGAIPRSANKSDFVALIEGLPDTDSPALFGLPANIDRVVAAGANDSVVSGLKSLERESGVGQRFDREVWATRLGPLLAAWRKPEVSVRASDGKDVVSEFLRLETEKAVHAVKVVDDALSALRSVVSGGALLSPAVAATAQGLLVGETPGKWQDLWEGPEDVNSWLRGLSRRAVAVQNWSAAGETMLGDLFRPATFLNALRQATARKAGVPMDALELVSGIGGGEAGPNPISVKGLWLGGAVMSGNGSLTDVGASGAAVSEMPVVSIGWAVKDAGKRSRTRLGDDNSVVVPVYETSRRESRVTELRLACSAGDVDKWILAGIAIYLVASE